MPVCINNLYVYSRVIDIYFRVIDCGISEETKLFKIVPRSSLKRPSPRFAIPVHSKKTEFSVAVSQLDCMCVLGMRLLALCKRSYTEYSVLLRRGSSNLYLYSRVMEVYFRVIDWGISEEIKLVKNLAFAWWEYCTFNLRMDFLVFRFSLILYVDTWKFCSSLFWVLSFHFRVDWSYF